MSNSVELPVWLVLFVGIFGIIGLLDRIIGPSLRWFFRRNANRAIDELNARLHLRIQPFKTTRRAALIDQLLLDRQVLQAIEAEIAETGEPRDVVMDRAKRYAREIVPAFNVYAYSAVGTRLARWLSTFLYRVRLGYADEHGLSNVDPEATVVFVMNHRSNMDYVLVTYLASASATLSYAVGEWARVWLLQSIIRAMGAYFIRRDSGNTLYRRVLARYVAMATRSGVTQAIFPEGGLSRDGLLRDPKFGLMGYMISDFNAAEDRDVVFVPVGLNYDRVLEDRVLVSASHSAGAKPRFRVSPTSVVGFVANAVKLRLQGRLFRYGYACASFGTPLSLRDWLKARNATFDGVSEERRFELIAALGEALMDQVGGAVPALPVAVLATVFQAAGNEDLGELEIKSRTFALLQKLRASDAHIHIPRGDQDYAITTGLRMLVLRNFVVERDGRYSAAPGERDMIAYYANSIAHLIDKTDRSSGAGAHPL